MIQHFAKTIIIIQIIISLSGIPLFVSAQGLAVPVSDAVLEEKEVGLFGIYGLSLDFLAFSLREVAIQLLMDQIKQWAASGFQGTPVFMENPQQFLKGVGEEATGVVIEKLGQQYFGDPNFFCSDIVPDLIIDVGEIGFTSLEQRSQCTMSEVFANVETQLDDFYENFNNGRFDAYIELQQWQNNRYLSYFEFLDEIKRKRHAAESQFRDASLASGGYLDLLECTRQVGALCETWTVRAPAKAIGDRISEFVGADKDDLISSDEITELVAAIFAGLIRLALTEGLAS